MAKKVYQTEKRDYKELRKSMGKPKRYTPIELWNVFINYLEQRDNEFVSKPEMVKGGENAGIIIDVPLKLPLSVESFCVFAEMSKQTFYNYLNKNLPEYKDYLDTSTRIKEIIEQNQIDGASVGLYKENIIGKRLGLSEKTETTIKGLDLGLTFEPEYED